jgi:hypothetical protein
MYQTVKNTFNTIVFNVIQNQIPILNQMSITQNLITLALTKYGVKTSVIAIILLFI